MRSCHIGSILPSQSMNLAQHSAAASAAPHFSKCAATSQQSAHMEAAHVDRRCTHLYAQMPRRQIWCVPYPVLAAMEGLGMLPDHGSRRLDTSPNTLRRRGASFGRLATDDLRTRSCLAPAYSRPPC